MRFKAIYVEDVLPKQDKRISDTKGFLTYWSKKFTELVGEDPKFYDPKTKEETTYKAVIKKLKRGVDVVHFTAISNLFKGY